MAKPPPPSSSRFWKVFTAGTKLNTFVYRLSGGRVGGKLAGGAPVILVHHVGKRSGTHPLAPLIGLADGDRWAIVASKGGTNEHPAWYHNLRAHPETEIEVGRERIPVRARAVAGPERAELWAKLVAVYPPYEDYQRFAGERVIPVVSLDRR